jgi:hypothetical protein
MLDQCRFDVDPSVFDGSGLSRLWFYGQRVQYGLGESTRADAQFQQADPRTVSIPGPILPVTSIAIFSAAPLTVPFLNAPFDERPYDAISYRLSLGPPGVQVPCPRVDVTGSREIR